ncbi:MAG TPA: hypothetical protein VGG20_24825 [Thermoanaerobaculia bacterium]|jgi:hypothetical protein
MSGEGRLRLKRLLFNLFYPAVLGTFFVSLLPAVEASFQRGLQFSAALDWKLILCLLIVAHFIVDYVFTEEIRAYRLSLFLIDLAVVVLLYAAYVNVHLGEDPPIGVRAIASAMAGVYACFLLWEHLSRLEIGRQPAMTAYEAASAIGFVVLAILRSTTLLALGLAVATLAMIVICGRVLRQYNLRQGIEEGSSQGAVNTIAAPDANRAMRGRRR